jgi:hypothetical protein
MRQLERFFNSLLTDSSYNLHTLLTALYKHLTLDRTKEFFECLALNLKDFCDFHLLYP